MNRKVRSKSEPEIVCHVVVTPEWGEKDRVDIGDENQFLQVAKQSRFVGNDADPHQHRINVRTIHATQEAWVVIRGKIQTSLYDIDDAFLDSIVLSAGDCLVTFYGGHGLKVLEDVVIYEFKSGQYLGQEKDKRFIKEKE